MAVSQKPLINFLRGWPNPELLPVALMKAAAGVALSDSTVSILSLSYAPDAGFQPLREQLAAWLGAFYAQKLVPIKADRICITGGASQNMACILQGFTDPVYTRHIWMVSPTYFLACRIFDDAGFKGRLRSVPEDAEGIDVAFLRNALRRSDEEAAVNGNRKPEMKPLYPGSKIYRHLVYAVPTFANPSSKVMTLNRREALVRVAREYDALIVTDDVYDQLLWRLGNVAKPSVETALEPRLVDVDRSLEGGTDRRDADGFGNAVSNGTFSKIIGPGCRTGWAEGTEKFAFALSQVGSSKSGGAPSQLVATFLSQMLESGNLQNHITQILQPAYAQRHQIMSIAIKEMLLPLGITMRNPREDVFGGYFMWLYLPSALVADEVALRAKEDENVIIGQGPLFGVRGDARGEDLGRAFRLCFAWETEASLREGIRRLAAVIERMLERKVSNSSITVGSLPPEQDVNLEKYK